MSDTQIELDIRPQDLAIVQDILRKHVPHHTVWAFGSRVKGRARRYSDLDLAVIGDTPLPTAVMIDLKEDFTESDLPWKVDVLDWATTSEGFRDIVSACKVVLQNP
jgi:predicted nucleotidyltransferase